jgi:hypothetical protein
MRSTTTISRGDSLDSDPGEEAPAVEVPPVIVSSVRDEAAWQAGFGEVLNSPELTVRWRAEPVNLNEAPSSGF